MLTEAVFEVGCNAGVILAVFLNYIQVPQVLVLFWTSRVTSFLGTSSHRSEPIEGVKTTQMGGFNSPSRTRTYNLAVNRKILTIFQQFHKYLEIQNL